MRVENPRYLRHDGRAHLVVDIDGEEVLMDEESTKRILVNIGLVFVPGFDDKLPPIPWQVGTPDQGLLRGFTDDRRLHGLYQAFLVSLDNRTFRPGPVS